jgi:uncharacterized small protein (DUF1192 family)
MGYKMRDDQEQPQKKTTHDIGQDLSLLSVFELTERIELLQGEILRLEQTKAVKASARGAADSFFKN